MSLTTAKALFMSTTYLSFIIIFILVTGLNIYCNMNNYKLSNYVINYLTLSLILTGVICICSFWF